MSSNTPSIMNHASFTRRKRGAVEPNDATSISVPAHPRSSDSELESIPHVLPTSSSKRPLHTRKDSDYDEGGSSNRWKRMKKRDTVAEVKEVQYAVTERATLGEDSTRETPAKKTKAKRRKLAMVKKVGLREDLEKTVLSSVEATSEPSSITYRSLQHESDIRIVILERGSAKESIKCRLVHTELGGQEYEALSYEWVKPTTIPEYGISTGAGVWPPYKAKSIYKTILVDGIKVRVMENLYDALKHIRYEEVDRPLWIDALCINQSELSERNHQVALMGQIYREATHVIAWLGISNSHTDLAMESLSKIHTIVANRGMDHISLWHLGYPPYVGFPLGASPTFVRKDIGHTTKIFLNKDEIRAIYLVAGRSYWTRMWIVQETQLATTLTIHCGRKSVPDIAFIWYEQLFAAGPGRHAGHNTNDPKATPGLILLKQRATGIKYDLHEWLSHCFRVNSSWLCSEPRDCIYALLSIAGDCQNGELKPDYAKPLLEVYIDVIHILKADIHTHQDQPDDTLNILNDIAMRFNLLDSKVHATNAKSLSDMNGRFLLPTGQMTRTAKDSPGTSAPQLKRYGVGRYQQRRAAVTKLLSL